MKELKEIQKQTLEEVCNEIKTVMNHTATEILGRMENKNKRETCFNEQSRTREVQDL